MIFETCRAALPDRLRPIYDVVYREFARWNGYVNVGGVSIEDIREVFFAVSNDHPELFYLSNQLSVSSSASFFTRNCVIRCGFIFSREQTEEYKKRIEKVKAIISGRCAGLRTEAEKEKIVCDYLIETVDYAIDMTYNQNAATVLCENVGQCSGISRAAKLFFDHLGIESRIVFGDGRNDSGNYESHAWNIVKIDGAFYHLDVTYLIGANGLKKKPFCYPYLNRTDAQISVNHRWKGNYPVCNTEYKVSRGGGAGYAVGVTSRSPSVKTLHSLFAFKKEFTAALDEGKTEFVFYSEIPSPSTERLLTDLKNVSHCVLMARSEKSSFYISSEGKKITVKKI